MGFVTQLRMNRMGKDLCTSKRPPAAKSKGHVHRWPPRSPGGNAERRLSLAGGKVIPAAGGKTADISLAFGRLDSEFTAVKYHYLILYASEIWIQGKASERQSKIRLILRALL